MQALIDTEGEEQALVSTKINHLGQALGKRFQVQSAHYLVHTQRI